MKIVFLGTGSAIPANNRSLPSLALIHKSVTILFDCGEGTQMQIQRAQLRPSKIRYIFISHFHGDHFFGLPGLLTSQQMQGRKIPLSIFSPRGLKHWIYNLRQLTTFQPDYFIDYHEAEYGHDYSWDIGEAIVDAKWLDHSLATLGFRYQEKPKPGKFNVRLAEQLGIPEGPLRQALQSGEIVNLPTGVQVYPDQVLGPPQTGKAIAYCMDTRPCLASVELAKNVNLLVHDATFDACEDNRAQQTGHSTVAHAAQIANQANVKKLALTHISARYSEEDEPRLLEQAQKVFRNTILVSDLHIVRI